MYKNIKQKIKQQRIHLISIRKSLTKQNELKREIKLFFQDSEEKLNHALQQTNLPTSNISILREKLADDQRLYAECEVLIHELRADIKATKREIEKLKLKFHRLFFPQKTCGFFKQKNANNQAANFSAQAGAYKQTS
ncbi:hypothetical protein [Rickettsiella endosymbiont of Rhagonycha lignosa]|uniref:hypothetical protein n=1 Tax=Rickettsiella endosymbiont of Rhagonycha lignosa TaxID=3077937 RepID=UPI00313C4005